MLHSLLQPECVAEYLPSEILPTNCQRENMREKVRQTVPLIPAETSPRRFHVTTLIASYS